jgi:hypothetical protein
MFWKARNDGALPPESIAQELNWGEEVSGLVDLPVKEILDRLKLEFPDFDEQPGLLEAETVVGGQWQATWTWQHLKIELDNVPEVARQQLIDVLADFGCRVYEA